MSATEPTRATDACVDTSVLVAIGLDQAAAGACRTLLARAERLWACPLLPAEFASAFRRVQVAPPWDRISEIRLLHPPRSLAPEIARVLDAGYLRGADCWHLATALWLAPNPAELLFLTVDERQREVAQRLGFQT